MSIDPSMNGDSSPLLQSKPAFLRRVQIRGYKSIAFCDVTLEPLTIFVGRNASGKSNFLDALGFLADLMDKRATDAVMERRGWTNVHSRGSASPYIEFHIEAAAAYPTGWDAEYTFLLDTDYRNQIWVQREKLKLKNRDQIRVCGYTRTGEKVEWIGQEFFGLGPHPLKSRPDTELLGYPRGDRLLLSITGFLPFIDLVDGLRNSSIYNFSPPDIRIPQSASSGPILARNGSNLARSIEALRDIEPDTFVRLGRYLNAIVPDIADFYTYRYGDYETVRFRIETPKASGGSDFLEFDASNMSDGTLRILASLVAAFQIDLPGGYPGFVGIEEPETSLHPAAMRALVDALDEATLRTQILLTTHSDGMLDNPTIRPENIRVVQMIDGKTVIGPVDAAGVEILNRKLNTLGGLERDDQLQPDIEDRERQHRLEMSPQEEPA